MRLPELCGLIQFAPTTEPSPVKRLILDNNRLSELDLSAFVQCEETVSYIHLEEEVSIVYTVPYLLSLTNGYLVAL